MDQPHDGQTAFKPATESAFGDVSRRSAHDFGSLETRLAGFKEETTPGPGPPRSADPHFHVGQKRIFGNFEIERRRSLANAPGGVVDRAVARAQPPVIFAFMAERDAAQMRANADHDKPGRL